MTKKTVVTQEEYNNKNKELQQLLKGVDYKTTAATWRELAQDCVRDRSLDENLYKFLEKEGLLEVYSRETTQEEYNNKSKELKQLVKENCCSKKYEELWEWCAHACANNRSLDEEFHDFLISADLLEMYK